MKPEETLWESSCLGRAGFPVLGSEWHFLCKYTVGWMELVLGGPSRLLFVLARVSGSLGCP